MKHHSAYYANQTTTMPKKKTEPAYKTVETITHPDANRVNIPTAEYQSIMRKDEQGAECK
jgi:hypothetical protein